MIALYKYLSQVLAFGMQLFIKPVSKGTKSSEFCILRGRFGTSRSCFSSHERFFFLLQSRFSPILKLKPQPTVERLVSKSIHCETIDLQSNYQSTCLDKARRQTSTRVIAIQLLWTCKQRRNPNLFVGRLVWARY